MKFVKPIARVSFYLCALAIMLLSGCALSDARGEDGDSDAGIDAQSDTPQNIEPGTAWGGEACNHDQDCASGRCEKNQCVANPFTTVWETQNEGGSADNTIHLPLVPQGNYEFRVQWGDGNQDIITQGTRLQATHRYAQAGEYIVKIEGLLEGWSFAAQIDPGSDARNDAEKLLDIRNWGTFRLGTPEHYGVGRDGGYFDGAKNLVISATDVPNLQGTKSLRDMFKDCHALTSNPAINQWDLSSVTDIAGMFSGASAFNQDIGGWDVSNVTDMERMFHFAVAFDQNLSDWNVSKVTNMRDMFLGASLSTDNYDYLLLSWSYMDIQPNISFHAGRSKYSDIGQVGRDMLVRPPNNWEITDAGIQY